MKRMLDWAAAPAASLFLILSLCAFIVREPQAGISIPLLRLQPERFQGCCEGRFIFVQLLANGDMRMNGRLIQQSELVPTIHDFMETRAERAVYVVPDSQIRYDRFVETLATLNSSTADLHIFVLSGKLREKFFAGSRSPCDLAGQ